MGYIRVLQIAGFKREKLGFFSDNPSELGIPWDTYFQTKPFQ
jgi:hypothetical protein